MTARQLDLFGATGAEVAPSAPHALGCAAPHDSELADSPGVRCEPVPTVDGDTLLPECMGSGSSPSANAEPYRFTLADPAGRWTITAAHQDEQARGKTRRSLVARCSCGWVQPFSARSYGTVSPDRLLAHLRTHQLIASPVICAAKNTSCQAGRRIWSGLRAPSKDQRELVWQYLDGCIVHYRCAPDEARHRFDVEYEDVAIGRDPHPADNRKPLRATLHGIDGEWMFTGLGSRGSTRRCSAILWRRLGAALALETPARDDRVGDVPA